MSTPDRNPGLPDWIADVPMPAEIPQTELTKDFRVPTDLLISALETEVGATVGSFSIAPELAQLASELSENPAWKQLPSEPTLIKRNAEDSWTITVGGIDVDVTNDMLRGFLDGTFRLDAEE